jgi:hypothetical protein
VVGLSINDGFTLVTTGQCHCGGKACEVVCLAGMVHISAVRSVTRPIAIIPSGCAFFPQGEQTCPLELVTVGNPSNWQKSTDKQVAPVKILRSQEFSIQKTDLAGRLIRR